MPSGTKTDAFTFVAPTLVYGVISSVGPTVGGKTVTVWGEEFRPGATVTFGGDAATSVVVLTPNTVSCVIPAHAAGLVDVVVTNTIDVYGDSGTGLNGVGTGTDVFEYVVYPPTVISVTPNFGVTAGGDSVTITGEAFDTSTVKFASDSATNVVVVDTETITCTTPAHAAGFVDVRVTNGDAQYDILYNGFEYQATGLLDDTKGWWASLEEFGGGAELILSPNHPEHCRHWDKIAGYATGGAAMLGGSPGGALVYHNHLIYAGDDYTLGSTNPTIRIFDGQADYLMLRIPNTSAAAIPKAIVSMLLVGDVIYLSTYDSGTSASDFAGRVFAFSPTAGTLEIVATGFSGGEIPYALAWHMGRLWVGTNKANGTPGKIYFIRPGIDTAWTTDYDLTTATVGGCCSLCSYKGLLYVGTDNAVGVAAKVLVRSTVGAYTTSDTASPGGTIRVNNGYLSMMEFGGNLYAGYWNPDTTAVVLVRKFDNSSWSTAYTGATTSLRPPIAMFTSKTYLFVVGGGNALRASLIRTADGTNWSNLTPYLSGPITETALPMCGKIGF